MSGPSDLKQLQRTYSECPHSALPASDALNAALRTNVVEGLGAAIRRVSHEQQLWAVLDGHPAGQPMIAAIDLMAAKSPLYPIAASCLKSAIGRSCIFWERSGMCKPQHIMAA